MAGYLGFVCGSVAAEDDAKPQRGPAALFDQLDADKDGKLTKDEVGEERARFFSRLVRVADKNDDGKLTKEEFLAGSQPAERPAQPANPNTRRGFGGQAFSEQFFNRFDKNGDGKLTLKEIPEYAQARMKPLFERLKKDELTREDLRRAQASGNRATGVEAYFKRLDANNDGKLKIAEVPGRTKELVKTLLRRAGKEEDDSITLEEFQKHFRGAGNPGQPRQAQQFGGAPAFVRVLDANRDGKISKEELAKAGEQFEKLDRNKDGQLDTRELFGFTARAGGNRPNPPRAAQFVARLLEQYDANKDGKLSKDEIPDRGKERYTRWDADKNGELTKDELTKAVQQGLSRFGNNPNRRPSGRPASDRRPDRPKSEN